MSCPWEDKRALYDERGWTLEYAPRDDKSWSVLAYDHNGLVFMSSHKLTRDQADRLADEWQARSDVSRVLGEQREYARA